MNVKDNLTKLKIPSLQTSGGYISSGVRQGGSYLNNYHKTLPRLLLGSLHNAIDKIHITCLDVRSESNITIKGVIENEYLLTDIELYLRAYGDKFVLIDRVPYSEWSFNLSAREIYTSNLKHIELKLIGINSDGILETLVEIIPIEADEDCLDICQDAVVEAAIGFNTWTDDQITFDVSVNGESIQARSLKELREALFTRGVEFIIYERLPR